MKFRLIGMLNFESFMELKLTQKQIQSNMIKSDSGLEDDIGIRQNRSNTLYDPIFLLSCVVFGLVMPLPICSDIHAILCTTAFMSNKWFCFLYEKKWSHHEVEGLDRIKRYYLSVRLGLLNE